MESAIGLQFYYVQHFRRNLTCSHVFKFPTNQKIAITLLANATQLQTMYHFIATVKEPEQHSVNSILELGY